MADIVIKGNSIVKAEIQPTPTEAYFNQKVDSLDGSIMRFGYSLEGIPDGCMEHGGDDGKINHGILSRDARIVQPDGILLIAYERRFKPLTEMLSQDRIYFLADNLQENLASVLSKESGFEWIKLDKDLDKGRSFNAELKFNNGNPWLAEGYITAKDNEESIKELYRALVKKLGHEPDYKEAIDILIGIIPLIQKQKD